MGSSPSCLLEEQQLEEYIQLTFLKRNEIIHLWNCFHDMDPEQVRKDTGCFLHIGHLEKLVPQLKVNPFVDRMYDVFFENRDDSGGVYFSFEEMLDICSALSPNCPDKVKAAWAFRIFDMNNDGFIGEEDLNMIIDRLTQKKQLTPAEKKNIVDCILKEADLGKSGDISPREFVHVIMKMPDFPHVFQLKV